MKPEISFSKSARWMGIFLLSFLLLAVDSANVQASPPPDDSSENIWMISVFQSKNPICVGDTVYVEVKWGPNILRPAEGKDGLAALTPLLGPNAIKVRATLGRFIPDDSYKPHAISGLTRFAYVAEQEGNELITGWAITGNSTDAIDTDRFTIKTCEYKFTLNGELNLYVDWEDISYSTRYTIRSSGVLKAPDTSNPSNVEGQKNVIRLSAVMTSFSAPKCTLFTWEPGKGMGYVDVRAAPGPDGTSMVLEFAPPQELAWDLDLSFSCEGDSRTVAGVYPSSAKEDPWISATFPGGSGQQDIKLDMFEIPMNKMNGNPGLSVSYTATVTLEKVMPE
jgi:hypothetical protein